MDLARRTAIKVPEITAVFWITKLLTTAMGEATADFFVLRYNKFLAVAVSGVLLAVALAIQLVATRYVPGMYWLAVAMVAVFGTMAADALHIQLKVPYTASTIFFAVVLAVVFIVWHRFERTLSIHSVFTLRRELFYWAAVLATFALGTAAGDLTANTMGLGYFASALVFMAMILLPAVGYRGFKMNAILAFWTAYVLTRPIGASFADWFGKAKVKSGLGWGDGWVALVLTALIIGFVVYITVSHEEDPREEAGPQP
ncbi:MAG TPA: hypothetical protein VND70_01570 [Acidimicrobiales bacterium]|nr:hypothetical protein [Acidimicrobiales bacterium]